MPDPNSSTFTEIARGVACMITVFVNAYTVEVEDGVVLVDAGLPAHASKLRAAFVQRYGADARPRAIILTHGHFDHAGSAPGLLETWDIPVYAHRLEFPYLTGRSAYPPPDPTVGGALAFMARFMPARTANLGNRLRQLPEDGSVPEMPGWRLLETPGHTPGHVSFFRESDGVLLAGDALATVNQDSMIAMMQGRREFHSPPRPFTPDWAAARRSLDRLAVLRPRVVAAGHGLPIAGADTPERLRNFVAQFGPPRHGRYVKDPARTGEAGVLELPPPAPDPLPKQVAVGAAAGVVAMGAVAWWRRKRAA